MTQPEFLKGSAIFAVIIAAAWLSMPLVDRYVASVTPAAMPEFPPSAEAPAAVCVQADGSYRNWPWPNTPTLSPKCDGEK